MPLVCIVTACPVAHVEHMHTAFAHAHVCMSNAWSWLQVELCAAATCAQTPFLQE